MKFFKYWLPPLAWALLIFLLSSVPDLKSELPSKWDLVLRKIAHVTEYAVFAMLLLRAFRQEGITCWYDYVSVFFVVSAYALSDEIHQSAVAGRHGSFIDWLIDNFGLLAGLFLWRLLQPKKQKQPA